ncbi:MAG: hypothetical protein IM587_08400 [Chitinophagaceae bacterium]|nr:hypothetical protein [Chitinophagaceae bacterium]
MKTTIRQQHRFIALLLAAGTIGLVLLVFVTSSHKHRSAREGSEIGLIKLI